MIDGLIDGSLKAMFIVGEDIAVSDPDTDHIVHALKSAEFLIVQDFFLNKIEEFADVLLPVACWAEIGQLNNTNRLSPSVIFHLLYPGQEVFKFRRWLS